MKKSTGEEFTGFLGAIPGKSTALRGTVEREELRDHFDDAKSVAMDGENEEDVWKATL